MACQSVTTAREESEQDSPTDDAALKWVSPQPRVDRLRGERISIGRADNAAIQLRGPGVSRQHAELNRQGPVYVLHDLGSTNGTWLGGRPVEHAPLAPGNVVRVGEWVGVFTRLSARHVEFGELSSGLFGGDEMAQLLVPLRAAAPSSLPVVLVGDTGTGKERLARAIHQLSGRTGPFVAINCAALPEQLAEGELFGYRRGAFTGADRASSGHFRAAHGGTLFLDEMPELSASLQAKLLRVVEHGEVLSLGESTPADVDVRIVCASQSPLELLVHEKRLRSDLAARLSGLELRIPALAERRSDIAHLFAHFLKAQSGGRPPKVEARLIEALSLHHWPNNVRELELLTRQLLALHGKELLLRRKHLPPGIASLCDERPATEQRAAVTRDRREHDLGRLTQTLQANGGNLTAAAAALGISRQRAYRVLEGKLDEFRPGVSGDDGSNHDARE